MRTSEVLMGTVAEIPQASNKGGSDVVTFGEKTYLILGLGEESPQSGEGYRTAHIRRTVANDGGRTSGTTITHEILAID